MVKAEYKYKCRLCNEVHTYQTGGWDTNILAGEMFVVTEGDSPAFDKAKIRKISPISYHLCKDQSLGVCDFVGIKKVITD